MIQQSWMQESDCAKMAFVGEIQDTQSLISCFPEISWRSPKCFGKYSVAWQDRSIPFKTTSYEQSNGGLSVWLGVIGTMNLSTRKSWRKMPGHKFVAEAQAHLIMHQDKRKTSSRAPLNGWTGIVRLKSDWSVFAWPQTGCWCSQALQWS